MADGLITFCYLTERRRALTSDLIDDGRLPTVVRLEHLDLGLEVTSDFSLLVSVINLPLHVTDGRLQLDTVLVAPPSYLLQVTVRLPR